MTVLVVYLLGIDSADNGLKSGWMPHGKLEAVKSAPRRAKDSDSTARPRLARQPRDDFFTITELLFGILAIGRVPFTLPRATDIHASTDVAAGDKIFSEITFLNDLLVVIFAI